MKKYEKPEIKVLEINMTDVITTSGNTELQVASGQGDLTGVGSGIRWTGNN